MHCTNKTQISPGSTAAAQNEPHVLRVVKKNKPQKKISPVAVKQYNGTPLSIYEKAKSLVNKCAGHGLVQTCAGEYHLTVREMLLCGQFLERV